jgi:hypothetical protein
MQAPCVTSPVGFCRGKLQEALREDSGSAFEDQLHEARNHNPQ